MFSPVASKLLHLSLDFKLGKYYLVLYGRIKLNLD